MKLLFSIKERGDSLFFIIMTYFVIPDEYHIRR